MKTFFFVLIAMLFISEILSFFSENEYIQSLFLIIFLVLVWYFHRRKNLSTTFSGSDFEGLKSMNIFGKISSVVGLIASAILFIMNISFALSLTLNFGVLKGEENATLFAFIYLYFTAFCTTLLLWQMTRLVQGRDVFNKIFLLILFLFVWFLTVFPVLPK